MYITSIFCSQVTSGKNTRANNKLHIKSNHKMIYKNILFYILSVTIIGVFFILTQCRIFVHNVLTHHEKQIIINEDKDNIVKIMDRLYSNITILLLVKQKEPDLLKKIFQALEDNDITNLGDLTEQAQSNIYNLNINFNELAHIIMKGNYSQNDLNQMSEVLYYIKNKLPTVKTTDNKTKTKENITIMELYELYMEIYKYRQKSVNTPLRPTIDKSIFQHIDKYCKKI